MTATARKPTFLQLYTPKLATVLREGYRWPDLKADVIAGLTVAIVALPLSMAIAIGSGVSPERGLYTSIVGGFVVSLMGGSRFQIGGPAGAFIVLVAATVQAYGVDGLLVATFLAGLILLAVGLLRLGQFIRYIPFPVTVGFTCGIAVIIFAGQVKELLGLHLAGPEPGPFLPKIAALTEALPTAGWGAMTVALLTILVTLAVRRARPHWPAFLIAVTAASLLAALMHLPVRDVVARPAAAAAAA
jgi:SulP family sulfate permease